MKGGRSRSAKIASGHREPAGDESPDATGSESGGVYRSTLASLALACVKGPGGAHSPSGPFFSSKEDASMASKTKAEPMAMLATRIPAHIKKALSDHAWATRRTMTDVLREILAGYLGKVATK